ncbi:MULTISPECIES: thioredoxin family protein [unclassified Flagellimonas]|jgi:thioredoxin-related protein|uniref:Thioredoxin family protein n=2 Tax=unclassified Flagellimonas TaxID=2644544 RepID=A0AAU7N2T8_9FLAO
MVFSFFFIQQISAQEWQTNMDTAKELALKHEKNIILVFQGSDWCAPCIKLDREVWSTKEFQQLAKDRFVMLKADFPRKKGNKLPEEQEARNKALAAKYNPKGYFPYVVVLDATGKVLGQAGYEKTGPKAYFNKLSSFK